MYGALMVELGDADGMVSGVSSHYQDVVRPALQIIGTRDGHRASGVYIVQGHERLLFFADCTMTIAPDALEPALLDQLALQLRGLAEAMPRLGLLGALAAGTTVVRGAQELRVKESDRIRTVGELLRAVGADAEERDAAL